MKRFLILCAVALTIAGCATGPGQLAGNIIEKALSLPANVLTKMVVNPVAPVNIYQAKIVYAEVLEAANGYREFCYSKPYNELMATPLSAQVCANRRKIVRALWDADDKAAAAIQTAEAFVRNNPTLDAASAVRAAITAVTNFRNVAEASARSITK